MKRWIPLLGLVIGLLVIGRALLSPSLPDDPQLRAFGSLPVLEGGRLKPLDTVARNNLLILRGKTFYDDLAGERQPAIAWLHALAIDPPSALGLPVIRIDHPDVVGMLGKRNEQQKYFSYTEVAPHLQAIQEQAALVNPEPNLRTPYERGLIKLVDALGRYESLLLSFQPPPLFGPFIEELEALPRVVAQQGQLAPDDPESRLASDSLNLLRQRYQDMARGAALKIVPPREGEDVYHDWRNLGETLLLTLNEDVPVDPVVMAYAAYYRDAASLDRAAARADLAAIRDAVKDRARPVLQRIDEEVFFNGFAPFTQALILYVLIFLVAAASWLKWPDTLSRTSWWMLLVAFLLHTFGLAMRMYLQDRPPVTNLYSSAIFTGWAAVLLALIFERIYRNGIGSAAAAMVGFATLLIAAELSESGDTLEMMRAVLDSNFWLATHVVTITIGYSANFLAGFLAIIYVLRGLLTPTLDEKTGRALTGMVYGVVCFALLFSFIGTVLGGIWADQSWGRFWGWDPKENGALMIVLWNALILHARWGGLVRRRGLMALAIGGNIIVSWSWFGTNMLGIGLHSYGFMDSAFVALIVFVLSQLALIGLALLPTTWWRSKAA